MDLFGSTWIRNHRNVEPTHGVCWARRRPRIRGFGAGGVDPPHELIHGTRGDGVRSTIPASGRIAPARSRVRVRNATTRLERPRLRHPSIPTVLPSFDGDMPTLHPSPSREETPFLPWRMGEASCEPPPTGYGSNRSPRTRHRRFGPGPPRRALQARLTCASRLPTDPRRRNGPQGRAGGGRGTWEGRKNARVERNDVERRA